MGWSKRGNGKSYDSLNGYGAIIGFFTGKILDYRTRNRKCHMCDMGHSSNDHDCRKNDNGSAKSMEADVGEELINRSNILKEANLNVKVLVGDEDSTTMAAINNANVKARLGLPKSQHLEEYCEKVDNTRIKKAARSKEYEFKKRRLQLSENRENLRKNVESQEGITYQGNISFETNSQSTVLSPVSESVVLTLENCKIIFFDLETSGRKKTSDILQIVAKVDEQTFSVYIQPTQTIDEEASKVNGLENIGNVLYLKGKKCDTHLVTSLLKTDDLLRYSVDYVTSINKSILNKQINLRTKSFLPLRGEVSDYLIKKLAASGLTFQDLLQKYTDSEEKGLMLLLTDKQNNKPVIRIKKDTLTKLIDCIKKYQVKNTKL
ncbi:PREDICTED: uncharacterized protein LOC108772332 [Cyphomyrmex costatus]|uniref:uncharacterized protein LOC108772332 n=1 Tax=Cyphomyrmex costatus TaxID=456900 RepID=UPI0008521E9A|nr:PREDICTED: uncharacterized protein LOC108772332 [Cyphomyrmex costatus]